MNPRTILCPIDFSENSRVALDRATEEAAQFNAKLYVAHVENMRQAARPGSAAYVKELDEHKRLLKEGRPYLENIDFEQHYLRGDVVDELVRFADARGVDRIIMGTHGRTGLKRVLMGSVAEAVSRVATCEVITVSLDKLTTTKISEQPFTSTYLM